MTAERSTAVIAVDGPSGSGKSSVSRGVAERFEMAYLDTGAMYRAMTYWMLEHGVDPSDESAVTAQCGRAEIVSGTDPANPAIVVDSHDVAEAIRTPEVTASVSAVSAVPAVRERMVRMQREVAAAQLSAGRGIVVEGRDIGSVVLPDADLKVYLTADPVVRAARRAAEDATRAHGSGGLPATEESIRRRDALDSTRTVSPLVAAPGSVHVDATYLTLEETINTVADLVRAAGDRP
ncbi:MAG: (d)CMP kinase [Candidatus Nanopelagicales bacterium]|nr:(d)CMP kinase [Candidatus Nanopelagicales bacterium]MDZ4249987.1 (d)CMP kinase [Candidatus Nanopelagicales bacterium]